MSAELAWNRDRQIPLSSSTMVSKLFALAAVLLFALGASAVCILAHGVSDFSWRFFPFSLAIIFAL
jgi:hypothetical protein